MTEEDLLSLALQQAERHVLILLDKNGCVVSWLMGASQIFGYGTEEMTGRTIDRLFIPEDRDRGIPEAELATATRHGRAEDDRWMLRKDGVRFWANGFVECVRAADGSVAGYSKMLRDRTDLRGQMETLMNRSDAFAAADRRKALVLGTLAHELRNPLGVLTNAVALIEMVNSDNADLAYASRLITRQSRYISSLIEDLLEITRAQAGKAALKTESVDLESVIESSLETAAAAIQDQRQRVDVSLPTVPIFIEADVVRLQQIFVNLLVNAAKFSDPGATIWINGMTEGDEAVVRFIDQGRGISPSLLPHVFELFSQAESMAYERSAGLGLGLSIVKEYVELHGGSVQVRSEGIGRGSEFIVRLPLKQKGSA